MVFASRYFNYDVSNSLFNKQRKKMIQLEFPLNIGLPENNKMAEIEYMTYCIRDSTKRVTRRLWAENNSLRQICKELQERIEIIERNICKS